MQCIPDLRHVLGSLSIGTVRSQLQASLSHFEGSLFSLDGQLYTGNMSAEIIHLLQSQRVLSLKLTVGLGALSYPGGEALVGGVPGRQHRVGSCGQVMLHLRPQLLTLGLGLCSNTPHEGHHDQPHNTHSATPGCSCLSSSPR